MRVLFTAVPAHGHLLPLLPLARAARRAGDDVIMSSHADLTSVVGELPFAPAGPTMAQLRAETARRRSDSGLGDISDPRSLVDLYAVTRVEMTFDSALAVARRQRPDVIVSDVGDIVAPLIAARLDLPWANHGNSVALHPEVAQGFTNALVCRYRDYGLTPPQHLGQVEVWPSWLQPDGYVQPEGVLAMQPEAYENPDSTPFSASFPGREHLPTILLTFGTVVDEPRLLSAALAQILELDVNVIVTSGPSAEPSELRAPRDRVLLTGFVPIGQLLSTVSAVVTVGGAGTVLATLCRGLPMVVVPVIADQLLIADRVADHGAGLMRLPAEPLGPAVAAVLNDPRYRNTAEKAAQLLATAAEPTTVWKQLRAQVRPTSVE